MQSKKEALKDILMGEKALTDWPLSVLAPTGGMVKSLYEDDFALFADLLQTAEKYQQLTIVDSQLRLPDQQALLANKNKDSLVLLVPEMFDGKFKVAALLSTSTGHGFTWTHVGYLNPKVAITLKDHWPKTEGLPMILQASLLDGAAARRSKRLVYIRVISPEYSQYIRMRDLYEYLP